MQELIAFAKAKPGVLNYATRGGRRGASVGRAAAEHGRHHIVQRAYRGGGPAMTRLLSGQIELFCAVISTACAYVKQGKVRARGHRREARRGAAGRPRWRERRSRYDPPNWFGMVGPAGLPRQVSIAGRRR